MSYTVPERSPSKISFTASLLACVFVAFLCAPAFSLDRDRSVAQFYYTFWSEKEGAPSQIGSLAQTEDGYLWIGSTRGLFRFDGVKFEEYKAQPAVELPSHSIYSLMATPDGGLWIAFEPNGLGFLKDGSLTVFTRPEQLPDSPIHCFARDHEGRIWAGTETGLVLRQGGRWIPIGRDWNLTPEIIRYLLVDGEGTLWVATVKVVAFLRQGSKAFELGGPVGTGVTTLAQSKDGRVWFADNGSGEVSTLGGHNAEGPAVVEDGLQELLFDRDGALWITRLDSGIVRIRNPERLGNRKYGPHDSALESFEVKDGFTGGFAHKLLEDREGNIWVGCSDGLVRFRHNQVVPVSLPQRYQRLTLMAGDHGDLWVGTAREEESLLNIRGESVLPEKAAGQVSSVLRDPNGDLWWGTRTGIWLQHGTEFKYFPLPRDAVPDFMYDMMPDTTDGGLWVKLGDVGFVHFARGVWNLSAWPKGVPSAGTFHYGPSASYLDPSGRFWLGYTSGQLDVLDGEHGTVYSRKDGLDLGRIKVIRGLGQHIWLGGELGLMFFSNQRFHRVTVAGGEPFGAVSGIIETPDGGLWLNEMRGIVRISPEEIRQFLADPGHRVNYRRFDYLDGLPGSPQMMVTNSTAVQASDGRLWFATEHGLARIDPAHLVRNVVPPPVSILSIGNEKGRQPISSAVEFGAGTHTIEIDYTALSLSIPERVEFRYKLKAVDTDWQNVGTRRQANYSNLEPGSYRFQVIACNNDGVWNDTGATLDFSIAPAYYQTLWFKILLALAAGAALWSLYLLRLRQATAQVRALLGERMNERERIARDLHDTLLQGFQGLMLRFQAVMEQIPDNEPARSNMERVLERADEVLLEGREQVSKLRAEAKYGEDLSQAIATFGEELALHNAAQFSMAIVGTPQPLDPIVLDEAYRIGREALVNAFGHSNALRIEGEITYDSASVRLSIRDDGDGIDPAILKSGLAGHWGLSGMRERAQNIGGQLNVWSNHGAGTEVELIVPSEIAYQRGAKRRRWNWIKRALNGGK
jgi:signal transduction histidine kinase/ligand-binding sensor domain-containing protein